MSTPADRLPRLERSTGASYHGLERRHTDLIRSTDTAMLQACLNGDRTPDAHLALPCTPDALATDAAAVVAAGAAELHVHPRGADGLQSLHPDDVGAALAAIRARVPGVPVGISTLWSIPPGGHARHAPMRDWTIRPDYVSINLIEDDAVEVMRLMPAMGIGIEAGLWSEADARRFVALAEAPRCLRVLVEVHAAHPDQALAEAAAILAVLEAAGLHLPVLLHGSGVCTWPVLRHAMHRGLDSRIGFEDTRRLPSGAVAASNADLVRAALAIAAPMMAAADLERFIHGRTVAAIDPETGATFARVTYRPDGVCIVAHQGGRLERGRYGFADGCYWTIYPTFRDGRKNSFYLTTEGPGRAQAWHDDGRRAYLLDQVSD